ncbi:MAG: oligosaccharide flippase family protein, partial [Bacteroidota bacterium]
FEGTQKMTMVAALNLGSRIIYIVSIFILIKEPSQTAWVNVLNGGAWLLSGIVGWLYIFKQEQLSWKDIRVRDILEYLRSNLTLFNSTLIDTGFRNSGVIVAGFILTYSGLGIYSILDKVILLLRGTFSFVYSALYPEVCRLTQDRKTTLNSFFISALRPVAILIFMGSPIIFFFAAPFISSMVSEINIFAIQDSVRYISVLPILILINLPIGLTLLSTGMNKEYFYLT